MMKLGPSVAECKGGVQESGVQEFRRQEAGVRRQELEPAKHAEGVIGLSPAWIRPLRRNHPGIEGN
jgi:hypothetical protein